jgi:HSP20 family protein
MASKSWLPSPRNRDIEPFRAFKTQLDSYFEDWFGRSIGGVLAPRMDVAETDTEVVLTAELPGVEEKDIEVSLVGDRLTIKGEKKSEQMDQQDQNGRVIHRMERSYGSFQRTMTVPYAVDPGRVSAEFRDGVLKIRLPKPEDAQRQLEAHKIEVKRRNAGAQTDNGSTQRT